VFVTLKGDFVLHVSREFIVAGSYMNVALLHTGNGYIGVEVSPASQLYIKSGRTLSFPVRFYPIVEISLEGYRMSGISNSLSDLLIGCITAWD